MGGNARVTSALRPKDGGEIPADLVVMTAGVRPSIELAAGAGLPRSRHCGGRHALQTYDPRIYAVGSACSTAEATFGLAAPIWRPGARARAHLAGAGRRRYPASPLHDETQGDLAWTCTPPVTSSAAKTARTSCCAMPGVGVYKRLVLQDGRLVGAVLYGDVQDGPGALRSDPARRARSCARRHGLACSARPSAGRSPPQAPGRSADNDIAPTENA
ncbi:FAD-dependent oxidoreductase [Cupriavidus basilensis]